VKSFIKNVPPFSIENPFIPRAAPLMIYNVKLAVLEIVVTLFREAIVFKTIVE